MNVVIELENVKWNNANLPDFGEITLTDCPTNAKNDISKINKMIMKSLLENVGELPKSFNIKSIK